jgi:hypothetical protein
VKHDYVKLPYLTMTFHRYVNGAIIEYTCDSCRRTMTLILPKDGDEELLQQVQWLTGECNNTKCRLFYMKHKPEVVAETLRKEIESIDREFVDKRGVLD